MLSNDRRLPRTPCPGDLAKISRSEVADAAVGIGVGDLFSLFDAGPDFGLCFGDERFGVCGNVDKSGVEGPRTKNGMDGIGEGSVFFWGRGGVEMCVGVNLGVDGVLEDLID